MKGVGIYMSHDLIVHGPLTSVMIFGPGRFSRLISTCKIIFHMRINDSHHNKTNKVACSPSEVSDQPGHLPSLLRVFLVQSLGR